MGNIDNQSFRNKIVQSFHFQLAHLQGQLATSLHTFCQTFQLNGHLHYDGLGLVDFVEVHVQDVVLHGMELDVLHDGIVLLAVNHEVHHVDMRRVDQVAQAFHGYREVYHFFSAIQYTRNTVFLTESLQCSRLFRGTLCNGSCSTFDFNGFHFSSKFLCYSKIK